MRPGRKVCWMKLRRGQRTVRVAFAALISLMAVGAWAFDSQLQGRVQDLYAQHASAMVRVKAVYAAEPAGGERAEGGEASAGTPRLVIGSGFFISREGLVLTNASIVGEPIRVWVEHHAIAYSADILGIDVRTNLALLRVHSLPEAFTFLHLSDTPELPAMGSFVLRLSMPLELDVSPQLGLVSGFESRFGDRFFPCKYVRTTIPAGPGDGGSAYLDMSGKLVGIQVGSLPEIGSSYMLPTRAALRIRDDLLFSGEVNYGWIGFEVNESASIVEGRRIELTEVFSDSPAQAAGLLSGDVIREVGGYPIHDLDDLRNAMFYTRVGHFVELSFLRDGVVRSTSVQLGRRPDSEPFQVIEPQTAASADGSPLRAEMPTQDAQGGS